MGTEEPVTTDLGWFLAGCFGAVLGAHADD